MRSRKAQDESRVNQSTIKYSTIQSDIISSRLTLLPPNMFNKGSPELEKFTEYTEFLPGMEKKPCQLAIF